MWVVLVFVCLVRHICRVCFIGHLFTLGGRDMRQFLEDKKWVSCGVNLDEDIHFSTLYLRTSLDKNIGHIFKGYSSFVAVYDNFNEEYFLEEKECIYLAEQLTHKIMGDFTWFEQILGNVIYKADILCGVFDEQKITENYLKNIDNQELKKLYKMQLDASIALYEYARIPEVLDRGVNFFTNFLLHYLKQILNKEDVYEEFLIMISTHEKSIYQKAEDELKEIIQMIPSEFLKNATVRSLRLKLSVEIKEEIRNYLKKWKYLEYHGYGLKKILSFEDILLKIVNFRETNNTNDDDLNKKKVLIAENQISDNIQKLFDIYPRLGITKLYRKYYQIRNFYFLDMILSEIAFRMKETEELVRCMLPEEILEYLETDVLKKEDIQSRVKECVYIYDGTEEFIVTDKKKIVLIKDELYRKEQNMSLNQLSGYPVSKGFLTGKCVIINRREDMKKFQDGDIVISDSADPDIFDIVKHAGAVLTVQGGATSHVALFCRERKIPAIVGIKGLMRIQDGTNLEVDAYNGEIKILYSKENGEFYDIGQKAKSLRVLKEKGFSVPDFSVLNYSDIKREFEKSEVEKIREKLLSCGLILSDDKKYIFRSSAVNEDTVEESNVGKFSSIANLNKPLLIEGIKRFITENDVKGYAGSIILQEMLPFDFCGVAITGDNRLNNKNYMTIELCMGNQNRVTEGIGEITRIVYDRTRDEIKELTGAIREFLPDLKILNLVNEFLKIERIWNMSVDIEWGMCKGNLYILQARPIVKRKENENFNH